MPSVEIVGYLKFASTLEQLLTHGADAQSVKDLIETEFLYLDNLVIPSLKAQTEPDFKVCVIAPAGMSEKDIRRLNMRAEKIEQLHIFVPTQDTKDAFHDAYLASRSQSGPVLHVQLYGHTAFCGSLFETLHDHAGRMRDAELLICPNQVLFGQSRDGTGVVFAENADNFAKSGFGIYQERPKAPAGVFAKSPQRLSRFKTVWTLPLDRAFARLIVGSSHEAKRLAKTLDLRARDSWPFQKKALRRGLIKDYPFIHKSVFEEVSRTGR